MYEKYLGQLENHNRMLQEQIVYLKKVTHPIKFWLGMFVRLPSVVFWGIKIQHLDEMSSAITIPYRWTSQNPFRSIYFAALAGAAELSTGALCQLHLAGRPSHSMLVVDFSMQYLKKANSKITFRSVQGKDIQLLLDKLTKDNNIGTVKMESVGTDQQNQIVAKVYITWSFKRKE